MKRFYKQVSATQSANGVAVELDGRAIKTPAGQQLSLYSKALADAVAKEWDSQEDKVEHKTMPLTTLSYAAIDQVASNRSLIEGEVAAYGCSDLICYRAQSPDELSAEEAQAWDPVVTWLKDVHGLALVLSEGVNHVAQEEKTLEFVKSYLSRQNSFTMAALERLTGLLGSVFLAIALAEKFITPDTAWQASRVDEIYQAKQWGEDEESLRETQAKYRDFCAAAQFLTLSNV